MSQSQDEMIRDNAGDEMNKNIQSPEGAKRLPEPDSNTGGVADDSQTSSDGQGAETGSVASEQAAIHEEAEEAKAAFAGTGDVPGAAGIIESDADGPAGTGAPAAAGGTAEAPVVDTDAPERAREEAKEEDSAKSTREPTMGEMLAAELGSDPSMKWESKIVEKMAGDSGAMDSEDMTEK